jgi:AAA+ ATPase superfamily predicted ATPase
MDLGFLEREVPFGVDEKNAKKTLYKIADPFMDFYYRFVVPNKSFIELVRKLPIEQSLDKHFSEYVSKWWELLCRHAVTGNLINDVLYGKAKRWWGSVINEENKPEQIEIDVIAESLDGKFLLVGECKWTTQENASLLISGLMRKVNLLQFTKKYTIVPVLFLKEIPEGEVENLFLPHDVINLFK